MPQSVIQPQDERSQALLWQETWGPHILALAVTLGGLLVAIRMAWASDGFYHDDDISHYLFARNAWHDAKAMWHWWARPGYNIPTMFVAHYFGLMGTRIFSALQTAAVAFLAYLIARRLAAKAGLSPWVAATAPGLVWLQPLTMTLAITTLTETPAALYLTLATWLYLRGNRVWACAALSACFVTRIETAALAGVFALAIVYDASRTGTGKSPGWDVARILKTRWVWACFAVLLWAPVVQMIGSMMAHLAPQDSIMEILVKKYTDEYGHGRLTHFTQRWFYQASAGVVGLALAGMLALRRKALLVTGLTLGLVAVHTFIFYRGSFASGGYGRFLVPLSGLVAALAACGIGQALLLRRRNLSIEVVYLVLAAGLLIVPQYSDKLTQDQALDLAYLLMGLCVVVALLGRTRLGPWAGAMTVGLALAVTWMQDRETVGPLMLQSEPVYAAVADCVAQAHAENLADRPALTSHVLVWMLHDKTKIQDDAFDGQRHWEAARPGTLFFWDAKYGGKPTTTHPVSMLYESLRLHGKLVGQHNDEQAWAEVYERLDEGQGPLPLMRDPGDPDWWK